MVDINIGSGQGMTQAIATNLNLSEADKKKVSLSTWQEVMTLVDAGSQKTKDGGSIFGNKRDASKIGEKSSNKSNFLVHTGQKVEIDNSIWNKIVQLLTGKTPENTQKAETLKAPQAAVSVKAPLAPGQIQQTNTVSTAAPVVTAPAVTAPAVTKAAETASTINFKNVPAEGDAKTGETAYNILQQMGLSIGDNDLKINVSSDRLNELLKKSNLSPEEVKEMQTELAKGFSKLGNSMEKHILEKFGDGSSKITQDTFNKFQNDGLPSNLSPEDLQLLANSNDIAFKRLDINKDGILDKEELSAYMFALDFDDKSRPNGEINSKTYKASAPDLDDPEKNTFDQKLAHTYGLIHKQNSVE